MALEVGMQGFPSLCPCHPETHRCASSVSGDLGARVVGRAVADGSGPRSVGTL